MPPPPAAAQRPARLRGDRPLRQLHARRAGAVRHAGRRQPPRRRRSERWLEVQAVRALTSRHRLDAAGESYYRTVAAALDQIDFAHAPGCRRRPEVPRAADQAAADIRDPLAGAAPRALPCAGIRGSTSRSRPRTSAPTSIREDVDISIHSEAAPADRPGLSAAVRRDAGAGLCAGAARAGPPLARPADLAHHRPALFDESAERLADLAARRRGVARQIDGNSGLKFENAALAYQAAIDRLGVMVALLRVRARRPRAGPAGRAVRPADAARRALLPRLAAGRTCHRRCRRSIDWIVAEARATPGPARAAVLAPGRPSTTEHATSGTIAERKRRIRDAGR